MFNSFLFVNFSIELCQVSSRDGSVRHVVLIYTHSSNGLEVRCISDDFGDLKTATPSDYQWAYLSSHHWSLEFWKAKKEWNIVLSSESRYQFNCRSRYSCIDVTFFQFPSVSPVVRVLTTGECCGPMSGSWPTGGKETCLVCFTSLAMKTTDRVIAPHDTDSQPRTGVGSQDVELII